MGASSAVLAFEWQNHSRVSSSRPGAPCRTLPVRNVPVLFKVGNFNGKAVPWEQVEHAANASNFSTPLPNQKRDILAVC